MTTESSLPHRRASCGRWRLKWMVLLRKGMKVHVGKTKMMVLERVKARHNVKKNSMEYTVSSHRAWEEDEGKAVQWSRALSMAYEHRTSRPSFLNLFV
ncbi:hypothetical protein EVAR_100919_1 [Eumeta japonica]|uniref:Uncharacterized protein n=1 Tax=Eumeta variegata TaxID=151549 RepID=A0A4C2ACP4_EUMVA|nr:hypothetical protein EVAR_100919_1 [Eumeta japonica]